MILRKLYILAVCLLLLNTQIDWGDASFLDYIWPDKKINYFSNDVQSLPAVPFELAEENERFLLESAKIMGNKISELDFCKQRVILQLKNSCRSLSEEQLDKLALALMNCQSQSEGREVFECSEKMSLKDCFRDMPSETWSVYNQFLSRAKAVCLTIRQEQFRAVAEMTVNRLMDTTNNHLHMLDEMKASQKQLEQATMSSYDEIVENNLKLLEKQQELLRLAEAQRLSTETNMREIIKEKNLLKSGKVEITSFITNVKNKIEAGLAEIEDHSTNVQEVYAKLVSDLSNLYDAAERISDSMDKASDSILEQQQKTTVQIEDTIVHLKEAHNMVQEMSEMLKNIRKDFEMRLAWLTKYFGDSDHFLQVFPVMFFHVTYLLIGMICLVFVNADPLSRALFVTVLCLNLAAVLYGFIEMDFALLTETIVALLLANSFAKLSRKFDWKQFVSIKDASKINSTAQNGYSSRINLNKRKEDPQRGEILIRNGYSEAHIRPRRTQSDFRSMESLQVDNLNDDDQFSDRSRSTTPIVASMHITGNRCKALTVRGTQCQLATTAAHNEFCRIHDRYSSER